MQFLAMDEVIQEEGYILLLLNLYNTDRRMIARSPPQDAVINNKLFRMAGGQ